MSTKTIIHKKLISNLSIKNADIFNNTIEKAKKYALSGFDNTYYLGYRDIPLFLKKYATGKKAIDYGCGTGRSTRFLKKFGFETLGVDISEEMLIEAIKNDNESHYLQIKSGKIPVVTCSYDLVFSCFVFFTLSDKKRIIEIFKEIYRCLKPGGIFIIVTGSEELYSHKWLSYNVNYPENKKLISGSIAKIQLKDIGIDFINYYWTNSDYMDFFALSGFQLLEKNLPMGQVEDKKNWLSETKYSPYVQYILRKK